MPLLLGTAKVWTANGAQTWTLYYTPSSQKHAASDIETLRSGVQKGLNSTGGTAVGNHKISINDGLGYLVYTIANPLALEATIFHYHFNYSMDLPL